jgi:hypothetical protein
MNRNTMVSFSPDTLEMITWGRPQRREWIGGGHAVFTLDGRYLLVTERYPHLPFSGKPEDHFGMITVRDPETLRVIDSFSCYGIAPHEINVLEDSKHIAVANYGSTKPPKSRARNPLPFIVEPCVTVLDLQSGRLVYKVTAPRKVNEVRHLAAYNLRRVFAIQARLGTEQEGQEQMDGYPEVYERDRTADKGRTYLSAPVLRLDFSGTGAETPKALEIRASDPLLMRHGLSIIYEPTFDEVIATFPSSHCYMVFDGANGHIKHVVHTDQLGLRYPCGLALYPNGTHYAISGYWQNLFLFRRGSHELDRSAYRYHVFFGHSHIAIA